MAQVSYFNIEKIQKARGPARAFLARAFNPRPDSDPACFGPGHKKKPAGRPETNTNENIGIHLYQARKRNLSLSDAISKGFPKNLVI